MGVPTSVQVATTENYVSTLDIHKPEIDDEYYERYVDELLLLDFMEMLGQSKPVKQTTYSHYEAPQLLSYITVHATVAAAGPANPITLQLKSTDHSDSGAYSYPRLNDTVHFPNGTSGVITAKNTAVANAHTITVTPFGATEDIGQVLANSSIAVVSNVWPAGSGGTTGRTWKALKYTNTCQIMKEAYEAEGSEMTNQIWFKVPGPDGKEGYVWTYEGEENTFRTFSVAQEMNLILTPSVTNPALIAAGYRSSEAMFPFVENRGGLVRTYSAGQWTLQEHKAMIKELDKRGSYANEYSFMMGIDLYDEYETFITNTMQNGAITYGGFGSGQKEIAIKMGFSSIYTLGFTFHLKRYRMFNNENQLGAPGFQYPGFGVAMPMGTHVHAKSGKRVPYFRLRNKQLGDYNRGMEHWYLGGAGNIRKTSAVDKLEMHYRSERSVEFFCAPQWVIVKRV